MIPKSLHTVTVLTRFALELMAHCPAHTPRTAVSMAASALGYPNAADPYRLCEKAVTAVTKAVAEPFSAEGASL